MRCFARVWRIKYLSVGLTPQKSSTPETKIFPPKSGDGQAANIMSIPQKRPRTDEHSEKRKQASHSVKNTSLDSAVIVSKGRKRSWRSRKRRDSLEISGLGVDGSLSQKQIANVKSWEISKICGGRFTPKSLFSKDEKYPFFH
jgi:hypothetical protein